MFPVKPLRDRVIVSRALSPEQSGSIIIPASARKPTKTGIVVACGEGRMTDKGVLIPLPVKVGDRIFFADFAGSELEIGTEKFLIMKEEEIAGVFQE